MINLIKTIKPFYFLLSFVLYISTSAEEPSKLFITIYGDGFAVINEIKSFPVKKGLQELKITEMPDKIDPSSIIIKPLNTENIQLVEKKYNYDIINPQDFLEKNTGKEISITTQNGSIIKGKLIKSSEKEIILEDLSNNLIIINRDKITHISLVFEKENPFSRPEIDFVINSDIKKDIDFEFSYITGGLDWKAQYISFLKDDEKVMEIYPFVIINNRTGVDFRNAKIKLLSGKITKESRPPQGIPRAMGLGLAKEAYQIPQFEEKGIFEYYSYTLDKVTDLSNNQIKELLLMPNKEVNVLKKYIYDGARDGEKVAINFTFKNTKIDGFGHPLPSGNIKLFKEENGDFIVLLGDYQIESAPVGKEITIQPGFAFDIRGNRIQKEMRRITNLEREEIYEITIINAKDTEEEVIVVEHPHGEWKIIESTEEYIKRDQFNVEFKLKVKPSSEKILTYIILYK